MWKRPKCRPRAPNLRSRAVEEITIRQLALTEMAAAAKVHRAGGYDFALPWLAGRYTQDEDRAFYERVVFTNGPVFGALSDGALRGVMALRGVWIDQLYVEPAWHGHGIGPALIDHAKGLSSSLKLWTFQRNAGARRFYERQGFVVVHTTDGARNEEEEPDALYAWPTNNPE